MRRRSPARVRSLKAKEAEERVLPPASPSEAPEAGRIGPSGRRTARPHPPVWHPGMPPRIPPKARMWS